MNVHQADHLIAVEFKHTDLGFLENLSVHKRVLPFRELFIWPWNERRTEFSEFWLALRTLGERTCCLAGFWNMFIWRYVLIWFSRSGPIRLCSQPAKLHFNWLRTTSYSLKVLCNWTTNSLTKNHYSNVLLSFLSFLGLADATKN